MDERIEELTFFKKSYFEGIYYYIFLDDKGRNRIVESEAYQAFHFEPGMKVNARVRKKGCAGEEISELLHPDYKEEKEYAFLVIRRDSLSFKDETIRFIEISDSVGNKYKVRVDDNMKYKAGSIVKCRLKSQSDGRLLFVEA